MDVFANIDANYLELLFWISILAILVRFWWSAKRRKERKLQLLADTLNGRKIEDGFSGAFDGVQYTAHFSDNRVGGAVGGPASPTFRSSMRVLVEIERDTKFCIRADKSQVGTVEPELQCLAMQLFDLEFTKISYDGLVLDVERYPISFDDNLNEEYLRNTLTLVVQIVRYL